MADAGERPRVKCSECGLLSLKQDKPGTLANTPVSSAQRKSYVVDLINSGFTMRPYCCVNACALNEEFDSLIKFIPQHGVDLTAFHEVIETRRVCPSFVEWVPALTPKEHFEMTQATMLRQEIESRRVADEAFREEVREADKASDKANRRSDRRWSIGQAAVIAVLVAILGLLMEPWKERAKLSVQPTTASSVPESTPPTKPQNATATTK